MARDVPLAPAPTLFCTGAVKEYRSIIKLGADYAASLNAELAKAAVDPRGEGLKLLKGVRPATFRRHIRVRGVAYRMVVTFRTVAEMQQHIVLQIVKKGADQATYDKDLLATRAKGIDDSRLTPLEDLTAEGERKP